MKLQAQGIQIRESVLGIIFLHVCVIGTELSLTVRRFLVLATYTLSGIKRVPPSSGNHGKPGKSLKSSMHGKIIEFEKI